MTKKTNKTCPPDDVIKHGGGVEVCVIVSATSVEPTDACCSDLPPDTIKTIPLRELNAD